MTDFTTATPPAKQPDPKKCVNYTFGMVLGVDDFQQEQAYFLGKHQWHHRALHGYGTVNGLQISRQNGANGPEILVAPGRAIDPLGRDIGVTPDQCARLNDWLRTNREKLELPENADFEQTLYVILCHRECATDLVPIPGEPCRSQQEAMAASRLQDDFELKLALTPPRQIEEETIREFGALLGRIEIRSEAPEHLSQDDLLALIRQLDAAPGSPPLSSPPGDDDILYLHPATAAEDLRAALRVWVTEVRPKLLAEDVANNNHDDYGVLLARLDFHVNLGLTVDFNSIRIEEEERPYALSTRLLQEWLLCGRTAQLSGEKLQALNELSDVNAPSPANGQVLTRQGGKWVAATPAAGVTDHGALTGLSDDDHRQYLPVDPATRNLIGNLNAANNKIVHLAPATAAGDAVRFEQAIKLGDTADGDLRGTYPNPSVDGLQGRPVSPVLPNPNEVLTWDGTQWLPRPPAASGNFVLAPAGPYAIVAAGHFNIDGTPNPPVYNKLRATPQAASGRFQLNFINYKRPDPATHSYIIKGTVVTESTQSIHTVEVLNFVLAGINIRITNVSPLVALGFMIEISEIRFA